MPRNLFAGTWELIPELSLYEHGPLPVSCTYELRVDKDVVKASLRWRMEKDGPEQGTQFGGPMDGSDQSVPAPAGGEPLRMTLTRIDERTLDSAAFRGDQRIAYARRVASEDGELLAVVQESPHPERGRVRNFQVYRRIAGPSD